MEENARVHVLTSSVIVVLLLPLHGAFLAIFLVIVLIKLYALIDAVTKPAGVFVYANKQTKQIWLAILVGALLSTFLSFFTLIGLVAALVYLLDVRPAITNR
jgi:uncharacterized membrane protein